jgi:hypothetical protein
MQQLITLLVYSALASMVAFVYSQILTDGGMILNPWYNFLDALIGPSSAERTNLLSEAGQPTKAYTVGKPRAEWLFKLLVGCMHCVAGQFAFWGYFWLLVHNNEKLALTAYQYLALLWQQYSIVYHIIFVSFAIYLVKFIAEAYKWQTNQQ